MQAPGRRRWRRGPRRFTGSTAAAAAASLLALWTMTDQFRGGLSTSSGNSCQFESLICLADADCSACIDTLQSILASAELGVGTSSGACEVLFADVCDIVNEAGCDANNEELVDLASCVAEDNFGCPGFTSCADAAVPIDPTAATPAPSTPPAGGGALDTNSTMQPSSSSALEASSPAPTPVAADASTPPDTLAPTAMVEEKEDTAAPTPSGSDGSRDAGALTASPSSTDGSRGPDPVSTPTPTSAPVEAGEETGTSGGGGGSGRGPIYAAVATVTWVSIVSAFVLAV